MPKSLSAGVLVRVEDGVIVVGHANGTRYWDIPKGLVEPLEKPRDAAVRELLEETGLSLDPEQWDDLGRHAYLRQKDLWLFRTAVLGPIVDLTALRCTSSFIDRFGKQSLEFDAFQLARRDEIDAICAPSLTRLLLTLSW
jgi:putative (di)nucleoside polyphosphate hydrolase